MKDVSEEYFLSNLFFSLQPTSGVFQAGLYFEFNVLCLWESNQRVHILNRKQESSGIQYVWTSHGPNDYLDWKHTSVQTYWVSIWTEDWTKDCQTQLHQSHSLLLLWQILNLILNVLGLIGNLTEEVVLNNLRSSPHSGFRVEHVPCYLLFRKTATTGNRTVSRVQKVLLSSS